MKKLIIVAGLLLLASAAHSQKVLAGKAKKTDNKIECRGASGDCMIFYENGSNTVLVNLEGIGWTEWTRHRVVWAGTDTDVPSVEALPDVVPPNTVDVIVVDEP